jgi:hypothetical protein
MSKTPEEIKEFISNLLDNVIGKIESCTNPRFILKHALRQHGLFLEDDDNIRNSRGKTIAILDKIEINGNQLDYTIRTMASIDFIEIKIDIGKL